MRAALCTRISIAVLVGLLARPVRAQEGTAPGVDAALPATSMRIGAVVVDVGCPVTGAVRAGDRIVVSCREGRVRILGRSAGSFSVVEERQARAEISTMYVSEGIAWAVVAGTPERIEAMPSVVLAPSVAVPVAPSVTSASTAPTPASAHAEAAGVPRARSQPPRAHVEGAHDSEFDPAPPDERPEPISGATVLRFRGAHAVLAPGLPLERGENVELVPPEGTRRALVVGTVSSVSEESIEVDIGYGEPSAVGDGVRVTRRAATARLVDPSEQRRIITIGGSVGAVFDAAGIGTVDHLELTWRTDLPLTVRARLHPFYAVYIGPTTDQPQASAAIVGGGSIDALLDTRYFAIGVGLGVGQYATRFLPRPTAPETSEQRVGFSVLPTLRAGPEEGLHVELTAGILAVIDEFRFGGMDGRARVPLMPSFFLEVRAGYWPSGLGFGEVGCRMAVEGNGGPGTIFVTPMLGVSGMDTGVHGFRAGPIVALGIEGRVGQ